MLVTTHSPHIVYEVDFACLRYFDRHTSNKSSIPLTKVKNLSELFDSTDMCDRFVAKYLKLHYCDIFFADAVIILEGKSEKILIPQLIKEHFEELFRRYISYMEIEGDYSHIFRPLLEKLGIDVLIITDLDSVQKRGRKKQLPEKSAKQISSNPVINKWLFNDEKNIDILINLTEEERIKKISSSFSEIYFAFQQKIDVNFSSLDKKFIGETIPRTFEDALLIANLELISKLPEKINSLKTEYYNRELKKIIEDYQESKDLIQLMKTFFTRLNPETKLIENKSKIIKAALALELLFICDSVDKLNPPKYIELGLKWLQNKLKNKESIIQGQLNE